MASCTALLRQVPETRYLPLPVRQASFLKDLGLGFQSFESRTVKSWDERLGCKLRNEDRAHKVEEAIGVLGFLGS